MIDNLTVDIDKLQKIVEITKNKNIKEVSFEFLVGSCFPKALENIKEEMRYQHALGFAEGSQIKHET